jgi:hypothetical protein
MMRRDAVFASNPGLGPSGMNAMAIQETAQTLNPRSMATTGIDFGVAPTVS